MSTRTVPSPRREVTVPRARALRWLATVLAFPAGGVLAEVVVGPVDHLAAALVGGLLTGAVLGAGQAWGLGPDRPSVRPWVTATALGLAAGLGLAAPAVGYRTGLGDLLLQGAICGLAVGTAQGVVLRPRLGRVALAWPAYVAAAWTGGWAVTTSIGVRVGEQFTVFGSSGALLVTLLTVVLPVQLARRTARSAS